jgi:hypothetical protein
MSRRRVLAVLGMGLATAALAVGPAPAEEAEPQWAMGERYLTLGGRPVYLMGANYIPSRRWLANLDAWDPAAVEADLAALRGIGVDALRWFPLWPLVQPRPDGVDAAKLRRIDELVDLAGKHGIHLQIAVLNGWMSGFTFLPPWADGPIFSDPAIVAGERRLVRAIASRYRGRSAVFGYDFGNELNVLVPMMKLDTSPAEAALGRTFDPWAQDPSHHLYEALLPATELRLDNPAVELFHERRGADEIAVLVNHTARRQAATLRSARPLRAGGFFDAQPAGEGEATCVDLEPAGVRVWRLHRLQE